MNAWWEALTVFQQIFVCVAIPSTVLMAVQFVLTLIGIGDMGADADVDAASPELDLDIEDVTDAVDGRDPFDYGMAFRLFTLRGLVAFLAVMGWTGYALGDGSLGYGVAVVISIVAGFLMMLAIAALAYLFEHLQSNGNIQITNAIGKSGTVYLTVPKNREGKGKINAVVQERYGEYEAVTDENEPLPFGTEVVIIAISGDDTLVVRRK
jgi:membrane protein implicated in regulation of membrane protease activity